MHIFASINLGFRYNHVKESRNIFWRCHAWQTYDPFYVVSDHYPHRKSNLNLKLNELNATACSLLHASMLYCSFFIPVRNMPVYPPQGSMWFWFACMGRTKGWQNSMVHTSRCPSGHVRKVSTCTISWDSLGVICL